MEVDTLLVRGGMVRGGIVMLNTNCSTNIYEFLLNAGQFAKSKEHKDIRCGE